MPADLTNPIFTNETKAVAHVEASRWPVEVICPLCGADAVRRMEGRTQAGMFLCNACRGKFTCRSGTVMERSHIPVHKWLLAIHLMSASKKGVSAHQLHRMLGITYKSAWFMAMRIREAMAPAKGEGQLGGAGMIVESDETTISGSKKSWKRERDVSKQKKFVSLVERGGRVRSHVLTGAGDPIGAQVQRIVFKHLHSDSKLHTDAARWYPLSVPAGKHDAVDHSKQFARTAKDGSRVYTNSAEGYFSLFKRGLVGTYQHMSEQHLHRYLAEFDFRMSNRERLGVNDTMRAEKALKGAEGKRLTYRQPRSQAC